MTLKVLCLHGYCQSGKKFREKTGAFRKSLKGLCEFVFIDACNKIVDNSDADEYAWWFSKQDNYFNAMDESDCIKGFDQSLELIKTVFKEQGPFDGILAFSQGAGLLHILLHLKETDPDFADVFHIKFSISVASFFSRSVQFADIHKSTIHTPTLLIYGLTDQVIPGEMTQQTLDRFVDKTVIVHDGGHYVPINGKIKQTISTFLSRFIN